MKAKVRNLTIALVISCLVSVASLSFGIVATVKGNDDKIKADVTVEEVKETESGDKVTNAPTYKCTISPNPQVLTSSKTGSKMLIKSVEHIQNSDGKDKIKLNIEFTNNGKETSWCSHNFNIKAYQNGVELDDSYPSKDNRTTEIQPGITLNISHGFYLRDMDTPIEMIVYEGSSWDTEVVLATYTITLSK